MIETDRFLIVDDCYNANPMSMKASLDVLKDGAGRRVAILGDMGELGENEVQLHAEVGEHAASVELTFASAPALFPQTLRRWRERTRSLSL